jgi:beta-glucosidase
LIRKKTILSKTNSYAPLRLETTLTQAVQRSVVADIDNVLNNVDEERACDTPQDRRINRDTCAASLVLCKNTARVLPIDLKHIKRIAVIGPNAKSRTVSGGGSAYMASNYVVTPLAGIQHAVEGTDIEVLYSPGCYGESRR